MIEWWWLIPAFMIGGMFGIFIVALFKGNDERR